MKLDSIPERTFIVRYVKAADLDEIERFYQVHGGNNLPRSREELRKAISDGMMFCVCENAGVIGAAGVFELPETAQDFEFGGTAVEEASTGFGLQQVLLAVRVGSVILNLGPRVRMWAAVKPDNNPSITSVTRIGFAHSSEPTEALLIPCVNCDTRPPESSDRTCCCDFFELAPTEARGAVKRLLAELSSGNDVRRQRKKDGATARVVLDVAAWTKRDYRAALHEYAYGG